MMDAGERFAHRRNKPFLGLSKGRISQVPGPYPDDTLESVCTDGAISILKETLRLFNRAGKGPLFLLLILINNAFDH